MNPRQQGDLGERSAIEWLSSRGYPVFVPLGGNQSWNKIVKRFGNERCDYLFVLVADGRRWFIPSGAVEGTTAILLGGPKYAEYEVERGRPFVTLAPVPAG